MISQLIKVDEATWSRIKATGQSALVEISKEWNLRILAFDPHAFTHAYLLLGQNPLRAGHDLSYYLATVNAFFNRNEELSQLRLVGMASDIKKRLSEDLAVAISSFFMNVCFEVDWKTITQIPTSGSSLTRKRPDFEGFSGAERHVWESKGVSAPGNAEAALAKAMEQVKSYPEPSLSKLAIVSYFSHDPRLFESSTFVVDPEMPDIVPPDRETAQLLHIECVLQFAGLPKTASAYMKSLGKYLKAQGQGGESAYLYGRFPFQQERSVRLALNDEIGRLTEREIDGTKYSGRPVTGALGGQEVALWLGARTDLLNVSPSIPETSSFIDQNEPRSTIGEGISMFTDSTVLIREEGRTASKL